jgi:DNA-binding XRE family transcriptional regulator
MRGPKALLNIPKTKRKAVKMLARGAKQADVARAVGVSRPTVNRWVNRDETREWIEAETQKYLESLPDALEISKNLIQAGKKESGKLLKDNPGTVDGKLLELATREAEQMRKAVGIQPTPSPSHIITNIYNDNRGALVSPIVQAVLDAHFAGLEAIDITEEGEVVEQEPEE